MNGKGCNLMVSPSSMAQVPQLRIHTGHSSSPSLHPDTTSGNSALLPALSLRRQVLTNGKLGFPQSSRHQAPSLSLPASSSKQSVRPSCTDNGTKGNKTRINISGLNVLPCHGLKVWKLVYLTVQAFFS